MIAAFCAFRIEELRRNCRKPVDSLGLLVTQLSNSNLTHALLVMQYFHSSVTNREVSGTDKIMNNSLQTRSFERKLRQFCV